MKNINPDKKQKKLIRSRLSLILLLVMLLSAALLAYLLISSWFENWQHKQMMASLTAAGTVESSTNPVPSNKFDTSTAQTTQNDAAAETEAASIPTPRPTRITNYNSTHADFDKLLELNQETVAWIEIPRTVIDYPVVLADDNKYYLERDFLGRKAKSGTIFMDYRNTGDFSERHTILYGHHMRDGSMFTGLMAYKDQDFFTKNSLIFISTPEGQTVWQIFSVYVTTTDFYYIVTDFAGNQAYVEFLDKITDKSQFEGAISPSAESRLLTLSTCTYEYDDARFVVHAIRVQ